MEMNATARVALTLLSAAVASFASPANAQPDTVHKTTLQEQPFPAPVYHTITVRAVVDHGGQVESHTHPGIEMAYIVDGHAAVTIKGQTPLSLGAGDSFSVPAETVHSVRNDGPGTLTIISTYVVEKDKPIASPAK
jgi:quercetin dioxygenase-like cupin family protein